MPSTRSTDAARPYHHGDLRAALVLAARAALERCSAENITLKELATELGVSQPAPYRHFESREALLASVAAEGFSELHRRLAPRIDLDAEADFEQACSAYLAFARENRGLYRLIFATDVLKNASGTELSQAAKASFELLLDRVCRCSGSRGAEINAVWVWSSLHGLAMLDTQEIMAGPLSAAVTSAQIIHRIVAALLANKRSTSSGGEDS